MKNLLSLGILFGLNIFIGKYFPGTEAIIPLVAGLIMSAAASGLKTAEDEKKAQKAAQLRATETTLSPWTHLQPQTQVPQVSPIGNAVAFGSIGANMIGAAQQQEMLKNAFANGGAGQMPPAAWQALLNKQNIMPDYNNSFGALS